MNRHDFETAGVVFLSAFTSALSLSNSFGKAAVLSALAAGLSAVAHKFLNTPKE